MYRTPPARTVGSHARCAARFAVAGCGATQHDDVGPRPVRGGGGLGLPGPTAWCQLAARRAWTAGSRYPYSVPTAWPAAARNYRGAAASVGRGGRGRGGRAGADRHRRHPGPGALPPAPGDLLYAKCGSRAPPSLAEGLEGIRALREEFSTDLRRSGPPDGFNQELERARRVADYLGHGRAHVLDALDQDESSQRFRDEHQTEGGEASATTPRSRLA
ncbi:hypothetical protein QJS66_21380 [Kocuria rhizophila]|nr:hypothetical protein QJS66_21380 [Kocuria rhizophila]